MNYLRVSLGVSRLKSMIVRGRRAQAARPAVRQVAAQLAVDQSPSARR